jgi:Zinc finger, C4 type (two domains).
MYMRRKCQECRLKKCLSVGMRPECKETILLSYLELSFSFLQHTELLTCYTVQAKQFLLALKKSG